MTAGMRPSEVLAKSMSPISKSFFIMILSVNFIVRLKIYGSVCNGRCAYRYPVLSKLPFKVWNMHFAVMENGGGKCNKGLMKS